MAKIEVGQSLWRVINFSAGRHLNTPKQSEVLVAKVGRKYADLATGDRIIIETMVIDGHGYTSAGKCYISKEDYDASAGAVLMWEKLQQDFLSRNLPAGVTIADIEAARKLLKV